MLVAPLLILLPDYQAAHHQDQPVFHFCYQVVHHQGQFIFPIQSAHHTSHRYLWFLFQVAPILQPRGHLLNFGFR